MAAEYITIQDRQYRVSHSWAAIQMFCKATGRKTLEQVSDMTNFSPDDLMSMFYCSIWAGEKLDGREVDIESPSQLSLIVDMSTVTEYVKLFTKQMNSEMKKEDVAPTTTEVKKKRSFWMKLRGKH